VKALRRNGIDICDEDCGGLLISVSGTGFSLYSDGDYIASASSVEMMLSKISLYMKNNQ
ncbi:hypothetical protein EVA_20895, partial [gut metagenome]